MLKYLLAAIVLISASSADARWRYNGNIDPFTDQKASTAIKTNPGLFGASIIVRCKDGFLESYFVPGRYIGINDYSSVRYRFDKGEVSKGGWALSTEGTAAFAPAPTEFARHLLAGSNLVIDAEDFSGTHHQAKFSLSGSASPIGRVLSDCKLMTKDPRALDTDIWRRVVQDVDEMPVENARLVGEILDRMFADTAPHGNRRNLAFYQKMTTFYLGIVESCEQGYEIAVKLPSCRTYRTLKERDHEADYPIEAVALLIELIESGSE